MRYCKYFIAKFNEAAVLHLDFWDICICQLHAADCDGAIRQTLFHLYGMCLMYARNLSSCSAHRSKVYIRLQPPCTGQQG